jgi:hypothetical protein
VRGSPDLPQPTARGAEPTVWGTPIVHCSSHRERSPRLPSTQGARSRSELCSSLPLYSFVKVSPDPILALSKWQMRISTAIMKGRTCQLLRQLS